MVFSLFKGIHVKVTRVMPCKGVLHFQWPRFEENAWQSAGQDDAQATEVLFWTQQKVDKLQLPEPVQGLEGTKLVEDEQQESWSWCQRWKQPDQNAATSY